jgi:hypothetical protein
MRGLRQIGAAREEVTGRRGFQGHVHRIAPSTRVCRIKGKKGSITQIPILTCPGRLYPPHPGTDRLHTGWAERGLPEAEPCRYLPATQRGCLAIPADELRYRPGTHKGGPQGRLCLCYAAYAGAVTSWSSGHRGQESLSERDASFLDFADAFENKSSAGTREDRTSRPPWRSPGTGGMLPENSCPGSTGGTSRSTTRHRKSAREMPRWRSATRSESARDQEEIKLTRSGNKIMR